MEFNKYLEILGKNKCICASHYKYEYIVMNAKALYIMRDHDDINTEHNMKSIGRAAVDFML